MHLRVRARQLSATMAAVGLASVLALPDTGGAIAKSNGDGQKGSGGRAVAHHAGGARITTPRIVAKAPDARLYRPGLNSTEPTLGVTEDNQIFYSSFQTNTRVEVMRSKDEGDHWEVVSPKFPGGRNAQLLSLDPYVYVDDSEGVNRVFTIDLTVACSYLSYSDDRGKTWVTNPVACGRPVNDHQTMFTGPPTVSPTVGYPNVVYYCWNDVGSSACSKSLDGGLTFLPTGSPAFAGEDPSAEGGSIEGQNVPGFCGGLHGHGYAGQDGTIYLPRGYCGRPYLAISKDEGASWTRVQVSDVPISGHEASVATDSKGNIYYTFVGDRDRRPYLTISQNGGKAWSRALMIGPPGLTEANLPSLDVGAPGHVAIAYMGSENSPGMPFPEFGECTAVGACPEPEEYKNTTWNGYMTETHNALDKDPVFYSATVNDPKDPLVRGSCGPGRCKAVYDFIDIVISKAGEVWSAWVDGCSLACPMPGGSNMGAEGVVGRLVP